MSFGEGYHKRLCLRYSFVDIISPEGNISFFDKIVNMYILYSKTNIPNNDIIAIAKKS